MTDRGDAALERIATALEQMALSQESLYVERLKFITEGPVALPTGEPPLPTPPPDLPMTPIIPPMGVPGYTVPLPPVVVAAPQSRPEPPYRWSAGMNHAAGHKPLKENNRGLYCPTKLPDGTWCQFAVKAG